jgi:hypothetical protein
MTTCARPTPQHDDAELGQRLAALRIVERDPV